LTGSDSQPIPISALEHFCYCPRQAALILVDGEWVDNGATTRGALGHLRVDTPGSRLERGRVVARAVALWSEHFGLIGRADAVEIGPDGNLVPVEYKIGVRHGDAAHVQVCAQALCLEEMTGRSVEWAALWFSGPRQRVAVRVDAELRNRTIDVIEQVRDLESRRALPRPVDDQRCDTCQLYDRCLPSVCSRSRLAARYLDQEVFGCSS
jgi:CRISPR-associated exonuclease Cas4